MILRYTCLCLWPLLCVLSTLLHAQTPSTPAFRLGTLADGLSGAYYQSPKTGGPYYLKIRPGFLSGPYAYQPGRPFAISQKDGQGLEQTLALVNIPPGIEHPLVMLFPGPVKGPNDTVLPYGTFVLNDSAQVAPLGSVRFVNASRYPVAVSVQEQPIEVMHPGQERVQTIRPSASREDDTSIYATLKLAYQSPQDQQWYRFGGSEFPMAADARYYVFLRPKLGDDSILDPRPVLLIRDRAARIP
ncbi:hypothetical protein H5P28_05465 [Ruficoccus amylovorans]|uniref:DUF4397 domain-containing protein n=1 Tax=Ruficoccus amylovorans TaxID=1804625 RepID=A0A842HDE2_9BACT|nr:hypothetical protein [Ruficoccus amylovorans]MBC2593706.1 hypothetical protein [Ruficoccus amylovorans]